MPVAFVGRVAQERKEKGAVIWGTCHLAAVPRSVWPVPEERVTSQAAWLFGSERERKQRGNTRGGAGAPGVSAGDGEAVGVRCCGLRTEARRLDRN